MLGTQGSHNRQVPIRKEIGTFRFAAIQFQFPKRRQLVTPSGVEDLLKRFGAYQRIEPAIEGRGVSGAHLVGPRRRNVPEPDAGLPKQGLGFPLRQAFDKPALFALFEEGLDRRRVLGRASTRRRFSNRFEHVAHFKLGHVRTFYFPRSIGSRRLVFKPGAK